MNVPAGAPRFANPRRRDRDTALPRKGLSRQQSRMMMPTLPDSSRGSSSVLSATELCRSSCLRRRIAIDGQHIVLAIDLHAMAGVEDQPHMTGSEVVLEFDDRLHHRMLGRIGKQRHAEIELFQLFGDGMGVAHGIAEGLGAGIGAVADDERDAPWIDRDVPYRLRRGGRALEDAVLQARIDGGRIDAVGEGELLALQGGQRPGFLRAENAVRLSAPACAAGWRPARRGSRAAAASDARARRSELPTAPVARSLEAIAASTPVTNT